MAQNGMYADMPDDALMMYVPDVYQPSIYAIEYEKLKEKGIKLITFDLDDTIVPKSTGKLPDPAQPHITKLKEMGFKIMLLSNGNEEKVRKFAEKLGVDYIAEAKKPAERPFKEVLNRNHLEAKQMAHVGNSIMKDIAGAKASGITTCLIRYVGEVSHNVILIDKKLKKKLKERGMWQKHHIEQKEDQYYQLGETQKSWKDAMIGMKYPNENVG